MKKRSKLMAVLFASLVLLTGCTSSELKTVYKSMQIGEGKINGYNINVRLFGLYNSEKVSQSITIQNYMNKTIKVVDSSNNKVYVRKDNKNFVLVGENNEENIDFDFRPIGNGRDDRFRENEEIFEEDLEGEETTSTQRYEETTESIPLIDTDVLLSSLKKAKDVTDPEEDTIANTKYTKYTYTVSKKLAKEILAGTDLKDIEFEDDIEATVWVDEKGYVYKLVYDLASGLDTKFDLELNVYFSSVNEASEISIPGLD